MKHLPIVLIFLCVLNPSCKFLETKQPVSLLILRNGKAKIDSIYTSSENLILHKTSTTYEVVKDNRDSIISVQEIPFSESGDWYLTLTHYFTQNGLTFAFQKEFNFFNSICTEGIAHEKEILYFNAQFRQIERVYRITDDKNQPLNKDSCLFQYNPDYQIFKNRDQFMTNKNLNLR
jgi:hypothetical protein